MSKGGRPRLQVDRLDGTPFSRELNGEVFRGHKSIRTVHERFGFGERGAFSELRVVERRRYTTADAIVVEETLGGVHRGAWEGLAPTGRSFTLPICTVYRFEATGRLVSEMVYFDRALLLHQLGVPTPLAR